jgi:hypothetical protein
MTKTWRSSIARWVSLAMLPALVAFAPLATAEGPSEDVGEEGIAEVEYPEVVPVTVPSREALSALGTAGYDLGEDVHDTEDGVVVNAVLTKRQQAELRRAGAKVGAPVVTVHDMQELQQEFLTMSAEVAAAEAQAEEEGDLIRVQRAQWYSDPSQGRFLEIEAWTEAGSTSASVIVNVAFNAGPGTEIGAPGTQSFNLSRFVDAGQYMFHRANAPVLITTPEVPTQMRVRTTLSGTVIGERIVDVTERLGGTAPSGPGAPIPQSATYQWSFIDSYVDATMAYDKIEELAAEFPHLAEVIELPYKTEGYRRKAQGLMQGRTAAVSVSAPASVLGDYAYAAASYGPAVPAAGVPAANTAFAVVDSGPSAEFPNATPSMGCGTIAPLHGAVALIDRGECPFASKTFNAQAAGASAVIIVNNVTGSPTAPGGTAIPGTTISTVMISLADGTLLKDTAGVTGRLIPAATGAADNNRVGIDSVAWGHEGGNALTIQAVDPGAANAPLTVSVAGTHIQVSLATNASGARTSTAAQVRNAINAHPDASQLVLAYTYRGNTGSGVVLPTGRIRLSDFLSAPDTVSREPMTVKMLRIGRHRDGSRVGVFAYSQEHAREWATPLVALESAERLLRNYATDDNTRRMVDDLDIFIAPSINPDGTHYSMYDFMTQRRTMKRYCPVTGNYDLNARNTWGVDLNRNFSVGSLFDGFAGASTSCTNDTYAGPSELSEPEAQNEVWVTNTFQNIRFSMNIHSHGGYFMWAPGAYRQTGRVSLPRPSYGTERFFYEASDHILNRIKEHRGTAIWDSRVGPISDVLYSAAGNSGDEHFYNRGIFAWSFEVGASRRNAANTGWVTIGNGFNPPFAEGYEQAMEFSNGLIGMFEVARMYARDTIRPQTRPSHEAGTYSGPIRVTLRPSEPADVYYTTDGSRPTFDSPRLEYTGPRQGEASILIDRTTTLRWFSVDVRGNVEGNYDPSGRGNNFRQVKYTIR